MPDVNMPNVKWVGCAPQNFRAGRPSHLQVEAVVIHLIDGSQTAADGTFLNPSLPDPRSAHYSVGHDGQVHQYVKEEDTAYHAGVIVQATWAHLELRKTSTGAYINPNYYTIGIEHEGTVTDDWTDAMYRSSASLLRAMSQKYPALKTLDRTNVVMHREIRANKACPGPKVDMLRLIAEAMQPQDQTVNPAMVVTTSSVNLRIGSPSRTAAVDRLLPPDTVVHVVRTVTGEAVTGSNNRTVNLWYETVDGEFLWTGATKKLDPGAPAKVIG